MELSLSRRYASALVLCAASLLSGCSGCRLNTGDEVQDVSYGQQLIDLKSAHEKGRLTDKEYEKTRKSIMEKMNK